MKYLSFSAYQKYVTCPHSYDLHYNKHTRPIGTPAYLPFGSAIDVGLNQLLLGDANYYRAFKRESSKMLKVGVTFSPFDFDNEILDEHDQALLLRALRRVKYNGNTPAELIRALFYKLGKGHQLSDNQTKAVAYACLLSLRAKARLMFDAYKHTVMPKIKKVHKVQEWANWKDSEGNKYTGVIDLLCELHGYEGLVLLDHKTSAMAYDENAVLTSPQLAIYSSAFKPQWVGFSVFIKQLKKNRVKICSKCGNDGSGRRHKLCDFETDFGRCNGEWKETIRPEATIQLLINKIPERNSEIALKALEQTHKGITAGVFPRNLNVCNNIYGKPCPYKKLCWENKMDGLETKKPEEGK